MHGFDFGWHYPPGVTGLEPELTGEWPCEVCGGTGGSREDGSCPWCSGTGVEPEDLDPEQVEATAWLAPRHVRERLCQEASYRSLYDARARDHLRALLAAYRRGREDV
jgi:hypothetical protein